MNPSNELVERHSITSKKSSVRRLFYYVSDLHLEQQLDLNGKTRPEKNSIIKDKVKELVSDVENTRFPLLIAGDVADCFDLAVMFYKALLSCWKGHIIAVLGNHELWEMNKGKRETVEAVLKQYKEISKYHPRIHFLENEILFWNIESEWECIPEAWFSGMSRRHLISEFDYAKLIILGGSGFSGKNPVHNADTGFYQDKLTRAEEIERSEHFSKFHDQVMESANFNKVIVLTHNPPEDWKSGQLCPDWIYVCGHRHRNHYEKKSDGTWILNDNQMGYDPCVWKLSSFDFDQQSGSDPLEHLPDGVHEISRKEYVQFNRYFGIPMEGFSREGTIFAIKHSGYYMFMFEGKKLYLLNGGQWKRAEHSLDFYDENMPKYISQVRKLSTPYYQYMQKLSMDVKQLGGRGYIHGCIVDIDGWNHIHCNPKNGKLSFYFAKDITNKWFYPDIHHLILESPEICLRELMIQQLEAIDSELMVLQAKGDENLTASKARFVSDTSMYKSSRVMRSFQYTHEQKVIRLWNDALLEYELDGNPQPLRIGRKGRN